MKTYIKKAGMQSFNAYYFLYKYTNIERSLMYIVIIKEKTDSVK